MAAMLDELDRSYAAREAQLRAMPKNNLTQLCREGGMQMFGRVSVTDMVKYVLRKEFPVR